MAKPPEDLGSRLGAKRPPCSKCATATRLVGIESAGEGFELLTFECPHCGSFETETVAVSSA